MGRSILGKLRSNNVDVSMIEHEGHPRPMPTVLVVDDARFARVTVIRHLHSAGYKTLEASDGQNALETIEAHRDDIDVILSDMLMPNLDGVGLLAALQERDIRIPCIMLTADIQATTREKCEALGCFGFINKPPSAERVLPVVASALERGEKASHAV